jgi:hypothetical protein
MSSDFFGSVAYSHGPFHDFPAKNLEAAIKSGARKYQGKMCTRGHGGIRFTKSNACCTCSHEDNRMTIQKKDIKLGFESSLKIKIDHKREELEASFDYYEEF